MHLLACLRVAAPVCDGGVECRPANFRGQVVTNGGTLIRFVITLAPPSGSSYIAGIMSFNTATNLISDFLPVVSINAAAGSNGGYLVALEQLQPGSNKYMYALEISLPPLARSLSLSPAALIDCICIAPNSDLSLSLSHSILLVGVIVVVDRTFGADLKIYCIDFSNPAAAFCSGYTTFTGLNSALGSITNIVDIQSPIHMRVDPVTSRIFGFVGTGGVSYTPGSAGAYTAAIWCYNIDTTIGTIGTPCGSRATAWTFSTTAGTTNYNTFIVRDTAGIPTYLCAWGIHETFFGANLETRMCVGWDSGVEKAFTSVVPWSGTGTTWDVVRCTVAQASSHSLLSKGGSSIVSIYLCLRESVVVLTVDVVRMQCTQAYNGYSANIQGIFDTSELINPANSHHQIYFSCFSGRAAMNCWYE